MRLGRTFFLRSQRAVGKRAVGALNRFTEDARTVVQEGLSRELCALQFGVYVAEGARHQRLLRQPIVYTSEIAPGHTVLIGIYLQQQPPVSRSSSRSERECHRLRESSHAPASPSRPSHAFFSPLLCHQYVGRDKTWRSFAALVLASVLHILLILGASGASHS
jgi:hypothetical protein